MSEGCSEAKAMNELEARPSSSNLSEVPNGGTMFSEMKDQVRRRSKTAAQKDAERDEEAEAPAETTIEEEMAKLPPWHSTLTVRGLVIAAIMGGVFSIISLKLGLTTGITPGLGMASALLSYFFVSSGCKLLEKVGISSKPHTRQENTVIQTCAGACAGMIFNGGFDCYLLAMDQQSYDNLGSIPGNRPQDVYNPVLSRTIPYMFAVALLGVFFLVPVRNLLVIKYKLPYPSGTATGVMTNSFFTEAGNTTARRQLLSLLKWFCFSFIVEFWKWFFTGSGNCGGTTVTGGFDYFPTFSLQAYKWTWYFNFQQNYIGVGMLCPLIVDFSIMFGAVISWGIMWPLLSQKEGDWYPAGLSATSFEGLYAYKVFIAIAIILADGIYILGKLAVLSVISFRDRRRAAHADNADGTPVAPGSIILEEGALEGAGVGGMATVETPHEKALRERVFMSGAIPWWVGLGGYVSMLLLAVAVIPHIYPPAKWYMCLTVGLMAPFLSFINAYGAGLTDWDMTSLYGKLCILGIAAWGGVDAGGIIAGLAVCGIAFSSISSAAGLMGDFRTGYLTLSSPRSMFAAQIIGALMGCVIAPLCFMLFYNAFPLGVPGTLYAAPYATVYRAMAVLGAQGFSTLPEHCLQLCAGFVVVAIALNLGRDFLPSKYGRWVPLPMAAALPFYIGAWLAIDMCIGALVVVVWRWMDRRKGSDDCSLLVPAVASGLIAGDGMWTIPSAILAVLGVKPPICMGWSAATGSRR